MIAPLFDRCMICGLPTRKPGEPLCIRHEIEALIALGYERMIERLRGNIPARSKNATKKDAGKIFSQKKEAGRVIAPAHKLAKDKQR
jgi:hypothetical protein